ncbi:hypothetical protein BC833DRAFT_579492 [Globomyces pollinis-pini]|nr:hypothetical protein BC833DRAFT_579492 [Globomyces pollinis-pini]
MAQESFSVNQKKPMNAFFLYRKAIKGKIMSEYGVSKSQDISVLAGKAWAMESDETKHKYHQLAYQNRFDLEVEKQKHQKRFVDQLFSQMYLKDEKPVDLHPANVHVYVHDNQGAIRDLYNQYLPMKSHSTQALNGEYNLDLLLKSIISSGL